MQGFKSFAEKVSVEFGAGITGIVGPNGSGKSNVADAVRWVLGEQSPKTLRGGKMDDVIFNGTEKRRAHSFCEVSLTFDNADAALPIDFAEVTITRRVFRDGECEYAINRAPCRLRDVIDLFRDTGVGKEGYSLIGQGRIDEILSVKSEDRRQVFEEAAGIVKYKARKEEAERRLTNAESNLVRVEDILEELSRSLEPLRVQSELARRFIALQGELRALELAVFVDTHDKNRARVEALAQEAKHAETVRAEQLERAEGLRARLEDMQKRLDAIENDAIQARERVLTQTRAQQSREGENGVLRERIQHVRQALARLEAEDVRLRETIEAARGSAQTAQADAQRAAASLGALETELQQSEAAQAQAFEQTQLAEKRLESAKASIIDDLNRASEAKQNEARLHAQSEAVLSRRESVEKALRESQALRETLQSDHRALCAELAQAEARHSEAEAENLRAAEADAASSAQLEKRFRAIEETNGRHREVSSRLAVLREMAREYEGYQQAVKRVLQRGEAGVVGVVASLMRVPSQLERALEMALGGALQNIVTETEEDAKRMIEFLRKQNFGRATFLPISAVRGRVLAQDERACLQLPGCLGVASELIDTEPRFRAIFDNLLGRTVIAEDLDAGIRIQKRGRHAFRVVTLAGDVMHSGGSMTGGSVGSRVTSLLSRNREIEEHEAKLQALAQAQADAQAELAQAQAQRAACKARREAGIEAVQSAALELASIRQREQAAQADMAAQRRAQEAQEQEREQLASLLADIEAQLAHWDARTREAAGVSTQQEAAQLQEALLQKRARWEALRESSVQKRMAYAKLERDAEAGRKECARLAAEIEAHTATLARIEADRGEQQKQLRAAEIALETGEAEVLAGASALKAAKETLVGLDAERVRAVEAQRAVEADIEQARSIANDWAEKLHRCELQSARLQSEYEALCARIWEEYELTYAGAAECALAGEALAEAPGRIEALRGEVCDMGSVNVGAIEEYKETRARHDELLAQQEDLRKAIQHLEGIIQDLEKSMRERFREQFAMLNRNFAEVFRQLFGGGYAELRLQDADDVLNCGIDIIAQPPGKKLSLLSLLSGGERALTAIAILFAMLRLKPTPFCILDEIEAALDEANISHFADFLREYARTTQFVIITHRKGTMECCDALYGFAMQEKGISSMVSVQLTDYEREALA